MIDSNEANHGSIVIPDSIRLSSELEVNYKVKLLGKASHKKSNNLIRSICSRCRKGAELLHLFNRSES